MLKVGRETPGFDRAHKDNTLINISYVECPNIVDRKMYHDRKIYGFYLPGSNFSKS